MSVTPQRLRWHRAELLEDAKHIKHAPVLNNLALSTAKDGVRSRNVWR
jgi:hypothetical protein